MSRREWVLIDTDRDVFSDPLEVHPNQTGGFRLVARTLRGGLRDGVYVVEIDNGCLRFVIVPDRGMGIWRIWREDLAVGWQSPVKGPVNPRFVNPLDEGGIGWLRGFDELICRCGLESNGPPESDDQGRLQHTLHGRIANLPAHYLAVSIDDNEGELAITGLVDETRLFGSKLRLTSTVRTRFTEPLLHVADQVTNLSELAGDLQLLYHINVGPPLAAPGSHIEVPFKTLVPRDSHSATGVAQWQTYGPEDSAGQEMAFYFEPLADREGRTPVLLAEPGASRGMTLRFDSGQLPHFVLWKSPQGAADGYVTGLEPAINFPNARSYERSQRRVARLSGGETRSFGFSLEVHASSEEVARSRESILRLQAGTTPLIFDRPRPGWSPAGE